MKRFIIILIAGVLIGQVASAQGWEQQTSPTANNLNAVVFVDSSYGWAVGDSGTIIHTTNGGAVWSPASSGTWQNFVAVDFVDSNHGWAVGNGAIRRTTDGGTTWISQSVPDSFLGGGIDVDFLDVNNGWVSGSFSGRPGYRAIMLMHTTDGGETWTQTLHIGGDIVEFLDADYGWTIGCETDPWSNCHFFYERTTDGGETWTPLLTPEALWPYAMDFLDANSGWVVGYGIGRTTDGGVTWDVQDTPAGGELRSVNFTDGNHGWAAGHVVSGDSLWSLVIQTTDGGNTWTTQPSPVPEGLNSVTFVDISHGWAVGDSGMILRYNPTLGAPAERGILQPSSYHLFCYPNPFNSSTMISLDLPKSDRISLRVFDLLGREVAVLMDGLVEAGTHRATFDGRGLASGIYFARLDAAGFSQTKKLMLLK